MHTQNTTHIARRAEALVRAVTVAEYPDDRLLTTEDMADWFGVHEMTIKRWRRDRSGPPHINAGLRAVRYRKGDVVAWLRDRAVRYDKVEG